MTESKVAPKGNKENPVKNKAIREHTDGREFRPWLLLGVTLAIAATLAVISYGLQIYFIGPS